ncbi:hypothetical protein B0T20DRAFT_484127 [Sordaria brevicollis]|uniref:Uncharacterized protein n=1 Tax=Sordaria brevicollis TaxID=83679 RepID=A0AAE0NVS3_SORBR|nr:hypothetical protein B0T20DRAFT_484127 [Sordaria brevicollis]
MSPTKQTTRASSAPPATRSTGTSRNDKPKSTSRVVKKKSSSARNNATPGNTPGNTPGGPFGGEVSEGDEEPARKKIKFEVGVEGGEVEGGADQQVLDKEVVEGSGAEDDEGKENGVVHIQKHFEAGLARQKKKNEKMVEDIKELLEARDFMRRMCETQDRWYQEEEVGRSLEQVRERLNVAVGAVGVWQSWMEEGEDEERRRG